jgi:hypothetical protein
MRIFTIFILFLASYEISASQDFSRTFSSQQLREDIRVLQEAFTTLHPGLYRYNSKQQVEDLFSDLNNKTGRPLSEKDFYLLLAKFTEKIHCGHTYLNPLNLEQGVSGFYMPQKVLPFCFVVTNRRFIITHNLSYDTTAALERGAEITKINGIPVSEIIDSLLQVSRSDGRNAIEKKIANIELVPELVNKYNLIDIFLPLFFTSIQGNFMIETKSYDDKTAISRVEGISIMQRADAYRKRYGLIPSGENSLQAEILNDSTCYLKIGTFGFWGARNALTRLMDSLFLSLADNKQVSNLIVDIRNNEGGSTDAEISLLKYILPRDFAAREHQERAFYSFLKVPRQLIPFLSTWDNSFFESRSENIFKKNESGFYEDPSSVNNKDFTISPNRFKGHIYLMTGPVNSSAAFEAAWIFKQYQAGTIIGGRTGGTRQGLNGGRFFFLRLPYSGIEIDLPFIYQAHTGEPDEGIIPDYVVTVSQKGIYYGQDDQLDFVTGLIEKGK